MAADSDGGEAVACVRCDGEGAPGGCLNCGQTSEPGRSHRND